MKIGRNEFNINENDVILDNGSCYQLITREVFSGWNSHPPVISKTLFNKLKKSGSVYTNESLKKEAETKYRHSGVTYWKFNIELINNDTK